MFSRFFIKRPIFATVIAILMVIVGLLAMTSLPISQFPDITPPTISVRASYPGANATTVAQTVGVPIEQQVNGVEGMMYMSSSSGSDGSYSLTITFENGTDIDIAAVNVQNRISQVQSQLPEPVIQEGVSVNKQATNMVLMCSFTGDKEHPYDALYLTNYCQLNIVDALSRVKGVGGVNAFGGGQYSMRIWLDPELMRARGISPQEVSAAIQSQNMEVSAGSVGQEPSNQGAQFEYTLVSNGRLITAEEFGDIIVRTDKTGILRLRDLGKVELGSTAYNTKTELNGKECALVGIQQLPGSNAVDVAKGVKEELAKLANYFPPGVHYEVVLDTTQFVDASIEEVLVTFVETSLIVLVVILLFLQQWRAVVIPMLTIPVSLIATFAVMKMLGFTINTLTLFGLVLAIAIVVDDAIVVVEDCARLVDKGILNRVQAAEKAMDELTGPVVGEVLVLLSVFIPTAFISGITGELYKQFALTIAISTAFSGFNALTFTPAMCALFLSPRKPSRFFIYRWFNSAYDFVLRIYKAVIHRLLHHPAVALGGFLILAVIAFYGYVKWPNSYIPAEDMGYFICSVQLPTGASLERTEQAMDRIQQDLCAEIPDIDNVMAISGMSFLGGGNASNYGSMFVTLKPWKERGKNTSFDIIAKAQEIAARVPEAIFFAVNPPAIPGLGMSSGLEMQLLDLKNEGPEQMMQAISMVKERADKDPRIASVTSMYQGTVPQYQLSFDRNRIEMLGLDLSDVYRTLSSYMGGSYVNDFVDFGRVFQVRMAGDAAARAQIDDILKLSVPNALGSMVPFATFTSVDQVMGQATADRYNMYATASLTANPAKGVSSSDGIKAMEEIVSETLGTNYAYAWTGQAYQETRSGTTVTAVFIFAIILTILFLAAQYESWTDPIAVVLSMPIAVLGVILGCLIMSQSISIYTQIGLILLLGLSAKNAILIVEYAVDFRRTGMSIPDSAEQAGVIRFRPIMMTALAFILGVMPMVFATGAGAESRISLGTAVVFGMAMNALFGTLLVPNFWELMQHVQEKYLSRVFKKESATMPPTNDPGDGNSGTAASV